MFIKEREAPRELKWLPRLMHRLPQFLESYEEVSRAHYRIRAGYGGEMESDVQLRQRANDGNLVIGDLQLRTQHCQIDTIVLTPHFTLVLEVKNYSGMLQFDEKSFHLRQTTRDGKVLGFNSPVTQVWNAREEIMVLFEKLTISLPVHAAIVLPYSSTLIENPPEDIAVVYGNSLARFISTLPRSGQPLAPDELLHVGQLLLENHKPFSKINYQQRFHFQKEQLRTGVLCEVCGAHCFKWSERLHHCAACDSRFSGGYSRALEDWFEFVGPRISYAECCDFLELKDRHAARYLLRKYKEPVYGK